MRFNFFSENIEFARDKTQNTPRGFKTIAKIGYVAASFLFNGEIEAWSAYINVNGQGIISEKLIYDFHNELDAFQNEYGLEVEIAKDLNRYRTEIQRKNPSQE